VGEQIRIWSISALPFILRADRTAINIGTGEIYHWVATASGRGTGMGYLVCLQDKDGNNFLELPENNGEVQVVVGSLT
jgi:hypothetical protein